MLVELLTRQFIKKSKAWFPLNVSVIATNRNCLLGQTLLRFAGFHMQPSFGFLRGLFVFGGM